jgi:hypothetical protein
VICHDCRKNERYNELFRARMARMGADLVRFWNVFDLGHK